MKNLRWNIISALVYTLTWLILGVILYWGTPKAMRMNWIGVILLLPAVLWLGSIFDRTHMSVDAANLSKTVPSIAPVYWAWLPTFSIGIVVMLIPFYFGFAAYSLYGNKLMGVKEWIIVVELTMLPLLNFISIVRTPRYVKRSMI